MTRHCTILTAQAVGPVMCKNSKESFVEQMDKNSFIKFTQQVDRHSR